MGCTSAAHVPIPLITRRIETPAGTRKTRWRATAALLLSRETVLEILEVVPVNLVSTWVLPSGVTVGR
jgi:hypothetical protein